jgi:hypothetical protein
MRVGPHPRSDQALYSSAADRDRGRCPHVAGDLVPRRTTLRAALAGAIVLAVGPLAAPVAAEEPAAPGTVVGEVVRVQAEPRSQEEATALHEEPLTFVEPARGEPVRLTGAEAEELPVGATVEVRVGDEVVDAAAEESDVEPAREVLAAEVVAPAEQPPVAPASPPYTNEVTVALVAPPGTTADSTTVAEVEGVVAGAVADYWERESYGAIQIGVTPSELNDQWLDSTAECEDWAALWAEAATDVGFVGGPGKHLLLYLPSAGDVPFCEYGLGTIGDSPSSGGAAYVRDLLPGVIAHELGHNFGLGHSSLQQCDRAIEGWAADCGVFSYSDWYDVMGFSWENIGSLSALHGRLIGVLPDEHVHLVTATDPTRDYALSPISSRTGKAGIRLELGGLVYWLEYRTAAGQDAWLAGDPDLQTGVVLRAEEAVEGDTSLLLDGTPTAEPWDDDLQTVLPAGRSYWLGQGAFQVTVKSATASQAVVRVSTPAGASLPRDIGRDRVADFMAAGPTGVLWNYRAGAGGSVAGRVAVGQGWQYRDSMTMTGDWNGDGIHDLLARDFSGYLWMSPGNGRGGLAAGRVVGRGWAGMNAIFSPGDWSGDGLADLVARRRSDGALFLYPGNGAGGFRASVRIGNGWNGMTAFLASGDWDANGTIDFLARRTDGVLLLYSGNGVGGFAGAPRTIGRGWSGFTALVGPGDWNGDRIADVLARRTDGTLLLYAGNGLGGFKNPRVLGAGLNGFRLAS